MKYTEVQSQQMAFTQSPSVSNNPKIPTNYLIFAELVEVSRELLDVNRELIEVSRGLAEGSRESVESQKKVSRESEER